jgi:hypothetical protein
MSHEIQNQVTELSADELDVVNGGVAELTEGAIFAVNKNELVSGFSVGASGTQSFTAASNLDIFSAGFKNITVG